jgi:hypothetical protein
MAPRQRRIVLITQQPSAEDLSPSPSETSSDCAAVDRNDDTASSVIIDYRTKEDIAKEDHDLFNLLALVRDKKGAIAIFLLLFSHDDLHAWMIHFLYSSVGAQYRYSSWPPLSSTGI